MDSKFCGWIHAYDVHAWTSFNFAWLACLLISQIINAPKKKQEDNLTEEEKAEKSVSSLNFINLNNKRVEKLQNLNHVSVLGQKCLPNPKTCGVLAAVLPRAMNYSLV